MQQRLNQQQHLPTFPAYLYILITFLNSSRLLTHAIIYPRVKVAIRMLGAQSARWDSYSTVRRSIRMLGLLSDSQEVYPRVRIAIQQLGGLFAYQDCYPTFKRSIRVLGLLSDSQDVYPRVKTPIRQLGGLSACQDCYPTVKRFIRVLGLLSDSYSIPDLENKKIIPFTISFSSS